jgi:hypothetical protein
MTFSERHLQEARAIIDAIDVGAIERMVSDLGSGSRRWWSALFFRCRRQRGELQSCGQGSLQ